MLKISNDMNQVDIAQRDEAKLIAFLLFLSARTKKQILKKKKLKAEAAIITIFDFYSKSIAASLFHYS